jgi:hypothetical protein
LSVFGTIIFPAPVRRLGEFPTPQVRGDSDDLPVQNEAPKLDLPPHWLGDEDRYSAW